MEYHDTTMVVDVNVKDAWEFLEGPVVYHIISDIDGLLMDGFVSMGRDLQIHSSELWA
jgi:hypothetical protein